MAVWLMVLCGWGVTSGHSLDPDLSDLSLLPLDKLIALQRRLVQPHPTPELWQEDSFLNDTLGPGALPLRAPMIRRGGPPVWVEEVDVWKGSSHHGHPGGKDKLSTIFQGTVTVLAFLAFGGYLLCLVLHVLKEKKAALTMTLLTTEASTTRRRRATVQATTDDAYLALRRLAEGYARYNWRCPSEQ